MTKIIKEKIKCCKCGYESEQLIVCSINYDIGLEEDNNILSSKKQKCPNCGYEAHNISASKKYRFRFWKNN